ncbi:MAG TPA: hypothetical protein VGA17_09700 [Nitrospiraceae bacterium]
MGKLFGTLFLIALLVGAINVGGLIWSGAKDPASEPFTAFTTPPPDIVAGTTENGYYMLVGFAAAANSDPVKTGYDIWREAEDGRGHYFYDYAKEGRTELRVSLDLTQMIQGWKIEDLVAHPEQFEETLKTFRAGSNQLLTRYAQWLEMPFDDEGYGHTGSPRMTELFLAHRVYLADGFAQGHANGLDRLAADLPTWRVVLAHAKTPAVKLLAAAAVSDDARLISSLLSRQPDATTAKRLAALAPPMTDEEKSLRWLVQHEFVTGLSRFKSVVLTQGPAPRQQSEDHERWLTDMTGLGADTIVRIEAPLPTNPVLLALAKKQRTLNLYAAYYENLVKAFANVPIKLPTLHETARQGPRNVLDPLLNPVNNIFASAPEPAWTPVLGYVREADARLRLASLQVGLLDVPHEKAMAAAIGKAGPDYYDPFTGIPMVWNAAQGSIYSVGRDGRDDGGESSFDVSIKLDEPLPPSMVPKKPAKPAAKPKAKPAPKSAAKPVPKAAPKEAPPAAKSSVPTEPAPAAPPPPAGPPASSPPAAPPAGTPAN